LTARLLLAGAVLPALLSAPGMAQAEGRESQGNATAMVVRPISTIALADLSFGAIAVGNAGAQGGSVIVNPQGSGASYTGSVRAVCIGNTDCQPHPARFAVRGEAGRGYRVTLPGELQARGTRSGALLAVADLALRTDSGGSGNGGQLDLAGSDRFTIGGTLAVPRGTPADTYRADFPVIVTYD
jgi:hypothetical protein